MHYRQLRSPVCSILKGAIVTLRPRLAIADANPEQMPRNCRLVIELLRTSHLSDQILTPPGGWDGRIAPKQRYQLLSPIYSALFLLLAVR